jgi:HD superfamily phosphohydrolase
LGLTDRIFIDASHSRLHHVVGVVEQADKIVSAIVRNLRKDSAAKYSFGDEDPAVLTGRELARLTEERRAPIRIMALLHDLTHAPYGHTLEDEINLVPQGHDEPDRQADAFYRLVIQYLAWIERNESRRDWGAPNSKAVEKDAIARLELYLDAPDTNPPPSTDEFVFASASRWARLITDKPDAAKCLRRLSPPALGASLRDLDFAIRALLHLQSAHKKPEKVESKNIPASTYPVLSLLEKLFEFAKKPLEERERFNPNRDLYLLDIIGNTICADLLDYAHRDATHAGLKLAYDPRRIISNMTVVSTKIVRHEVQTKEGPKRFPFNNESLRTAVSIFSHKLRLDVPGELLNLLQVRFYVYERVLFHPTKCVAGAMLGAAMQNIGWKTLPQHWTHVGDGTLLREARDAARFIRDFLDSLADKDKHFGLEHADMLEARLQSFPVAGVTAAIQDWLRDRSTLTSEELIRHLEAIAKVERYNRAANAILILIGEMHEKVPKEIPPTEWPKWRITFLGAAEKTRVNAAEVVDLIFPRITHLYEQARGGIRLLDRIAARRYHKVVFRLLSNAPSNNDGATDLTPEQIAKDFVDPVLRKYVEWEIADQAGLPRGTIAIHCPPAKGPTKIANILMTDGQSTEHPKLRDLKTLDKHLFEHHETAVTTLEAMYKSTWRLAVSVAPPYDADWRKLDPIIGTALYKALGGSGRLENDRHMVRELEGQVDAVSRSYERDLAAARRLIRDEQDLSELGNGILDLLQEMGAKVSREPQVIISELRARLNARSQDEQEAPPSERARTGLRAGGAFWSTQKHARETLTLKFGAIFRGDDRSREIYRRMIALTPTQQRWLESRLESIEVPASVADNRIVSAEEIDNVFDRVIELLAEAEYIGEASL